MKRRVVFINNGALLRGEWALRTSGREQQRYFVDGRLTQEILKSPLPAAAFVAPQRQRQPLLQSLPSMSTLRGSHLLPVFIATNKSMRNSETNDHSRNGPQRIAALKIDLLHLHTGCSTTSSTHARMHACTHRSHICAQYPRRLGVHFLASGRGE